MKFRRKEEKRLHAHSSQQPVGEQKKKKEPRTPLLGHKLRGKTPSLRGGKGKDPPKGDGQEKSLTDQRGEKLFQKNPDRGKLSV